jgi:hypothetical protein
MILQIEPGGAYNAALLGKRDLVGAAAEILPRPVLDFNESHGLPVADNEINFPASATEISINDSNVLTAQPALRFPFPVSALEATQSSQPGHAGRANLTCRMQQAGRFEIRPSKAPAPGRLPRRLTRFHSGREI